MEKQIVNIAKLMQYKLDKNKHKDCKVMNADGIGRKWDNCSVEWLRKRMLEEADELYDAILQRLSPKEIALECADVCNFAMMIADNVGGLEEPTIETTDNANLGDVTNLVCDFEKPQHCPLHWNGVECNECDYKHLGIPNICFSLTDKDDKREVDFKKQRLERGFGDSETWSLRDTMANFIIPRLKRYQEIANDFLKRDEELVNDIDCFLKAMELAARDNGSCIFTKEEKKQLSEGLDKFPKIFMSLWW